MGRHTWIEIARGTWRGAALFGLGGLAALEWLARPSCRRDAAGRAAWLARLCGRFLRALNVRVERAGERPAPGTLLVANHIGYIDIIVLAANGPVLFVAKREVRGWPLFGWMAARAGTCFIDRGRARDATRAADEIGEALRAGVSVVVFLEGTSTDGRGVAPFKAALLGPAVAAGWSVTPMAVDYRAPAGRSVVDEVAWWGDMTLAGHLANFLTIPELNARLAWGASRRAEGDRKILAARLRDEVIGLRAEPGGEAGAHEHDFER